MTAQEAFEALVGLIPDVETHGDELEALRAAVDESQSIADLTDERAQLIAERDEYRAKYDNAAAEIRRRWTDKSNDTTITKTSEFSATAPESPADVKLSDFDFEKNFFNGGTE